MCIIDWYVFTQSFIGLIPYLYEYFKFFHYHFALIDTISFPILSAYLLASY